MTLAAPCNQEVFDKGITIAMMAGKGSAEIETYVKSIAQKTGQLVDWHYVGGRAYVKVLGDVEIVRKAITNNQESGFQFLIY